VDTRTGRFALGLLVFGGATMAQAQGPAQPTTPFYIGLDVGRSKLEASASSQFFSAADGSRSGDDTGYRFRAGYQFSANFALELGYVDFGQFTARNIEAYCATQGGATCFYDLDSSTDGGFVNLLWSWRFHPGWSLDTRLGAFNANVHNTEQETGVPGSRVRSSDTNTALMYGLGVSYEITPRLGVGLEFSEYEQIGLGLGLGGGPAIFDLGSSRLASLGITYRF
jgi:opacity protein-like surface antigen